LGTETEQKEVLSVRLISRSNAQMPVGLVLGRI